MTGRDALAPQVSKPHNLEESNLINALAEALQARNLTVAVAESCTGGLLGGALTSMSGSSAYFLGGVIAYSDRVKIDLLEVAPEIIACYGAVSPEVALAMARGVARLTAADIAISVTGISGPLGGTLAKPVGSTYLAVVSAHSSESSYFCWGGSRDANRNQSVLAALKLTLRHVEENFPRQTTV